MKIKVDINTAQIMKKRGLGGDHRAQKFLASQVQKFCDPYVPMSSGLLKNQAVVASDGSTLTYTQPYAHYQYYGKVMGPNYMDKEGKWHSGKAPKKYTGKDLTYHGAPMRGPEWDKRMLADKHDDLVRNLKAYIGGLS